MNEEQMSIFEWYMTRLVLKNGYQTYTCYKEIGPCAQNKDNILY